MAIAEHNPDNLYARNKGVANMSKSQLHDFASTPRTGLPNHVPKLADGHKPMTNTTFQQSERTSGSRPTWMAVASAHAQNKPMPTLADGKRPKLSDKMPGGFNKPLDSANFGADGIAPKFRVKSVRQVTVAEPVQKPLRKRVYGSRTPMMADGGKWAGKAFEHAGERGHSLHASLHIPKDQKIPEKRLNAATHSKNAHIRHQAQAAENI
jgi:hypothetical protein